MITDIIFWCFLFGSAALFWLLPLTLRLPALSLGSLGFIVYVAPGSAAWLVILAAVTWLALPRIAARDQLALWALLGMIGVIAGPLVLLKATAAYGLPWLDGSVLRFAVPLGMSYYAFRLMHVALDAYRFGERPASATMFFTYAFMFTIFVAGPIERYENFAAGRISAFDPRLVRDDLTRIAIGLIKQGVLIELLIILRALMIGDDFHRMHGAKLLAAPALSLWVLAIFGYLIAYLNLGAYSDIAIGASKLFGFNISENFNYPIFARTLSDFWRRWHMTLSSWCQAYVFAPVLGVTRLPHLALVASFLVMGLWHMLTPGRVAWGLAHAGGLIALYVSRQFWKLQKVTFVSSWWWAALGWLATQAFVSLTFLLVHEEASRSVITTLRVVAKAATFGLVS